MRAGCDDVDGSASRLGRTVVDVDVDRCPVGVGHLGSIVAEVNMERFLLNWIECETRRLEIKPFPFIAFHPKTTRNIRTLPLSERQSRS